MACDIMLTRYPQPKNEDAFEDFCLVLLREHWLLPTLQRYGHRGERQHGVDLLDTGGRGPLRAVQCKHHDATKTLPPRELEAEVEKAKGFPTKIDEFFILTTAKKAAQAQQKVLAINKEHSEKGLFTVQLLTWDEIELIVACSPAAQELLGIQLPAVLRASLKAELSPVHEVSRSLGNELHGAELDEVKMQLEDGEAQLAALLLERLRKKSWDQMSPRHRFRWCTFFADIELRQGNERKAAQSLIEAKSHQPDDDNAIANEITAYEMLGNRTRAFELAAAAIVARPHSSPIYAAAIRAAPSLPDLSRLLENLPDHLKEDPQVWVAAATRGDLEPPPEKAEATARQATALGQDDPRGWFALGCILLRSELERSGPGSVPGSAAPIRARVEEARDCFTKAVELSARRGVRGSQATALVRRAMAQEFLGFSREAQEDVEEARLVDPENIGIVVALARREEERGRHEEALRLLRQVVMRRPDDEARYVLGIVLWNRNSPGDRAEAVCLLASVGLGDGLHVESANEVAVEGMIIEGRHAEARAHLDRVESRLDPCLVAIFKARIAAALGEAERASTTATEAVQKLEERTSRGTLRKLAVLLISFGRPADALPIWERLVIPGEVNDDVRSFVDCAARLDRHGKVLATCASVREAGTFDPFLLQWELRFLDRYDPDTALGVLEEIIRRGAPNKTAHLHLVHLALRLEKYDLARSHLANLPPVTEVEAEEGAAVVGALTKLGHRADAVAYAYDLLRRYFQDHYAHRAFRDAMMSRDRGEDIGEPKEAGPGVAVLLAEEGVDSPQWFVLEDSEVAARGVENEIAADSPLARKLIGKKVGEEVALSEGPGVGRKAAVQKLASKLVFRLGDVWHRWQYRFPEQQEMWVVRIMQQGEDKPDFSSLFEVAKDHQRQRKEAEALYAKQAISVSLFGQALGKTEIYAVHHLATEDSLTLRCCTGSYEEYAAAESALKAATEVVLDLTAITTLMMLEEVGVLGTLGKAVLVTHSTMAGVRAFVEEARTRMRSEGSMGANEHGPLLFRQSSDEKRAALDAAEECKRIIEQRCRIVGCPELAHVDPTERKWMEEGVGSSSMESIVLGAGASRIMWTDDYVVGLLGREKFGARRVWTQGVLKWLFERGVLPNKRYARASARLVGWRYMFTSVNVEVMRVAGNQGEWSPERWPLKQTIDYLSRPVVRLEDAAALSANLVAHCYLEVVLPEARRVLLQAVVEGLARRADAQRALSLFGSALEPAFGLNAIGHADALQTFIAWKREFLRRRWPMWG